MSVPKSIPAVTNSPVTLTYSSTQLTSSSKKSPAFFQVWLDLHTFQNNTLVLPQSQCCGSRKPQLWLTRFIGSGSTGKVWQCQFNDSDDLFAIKIAEPLCKSEAASRKRLHNEFEVYLSLEEAYQSGKLPDRIAPHISDFTEIL